MSERVAAIIYDMFLSYRGTYRETLRPSVEIRPTNSANRDQLAPNITGAKLVTILAIQSLQSGTYY